MSPRPVWASALLATALSATAADPAHDFDFLHGRWETLNHRRVKPLSGDERWETFRTRLRCDPLPGGFGNVDLFESDGPWRPGYKALTLRIHNPTTQRWSIYWLDPRNAGMPADDGRLDVPVVGGFEAGVGTFTSAELWEGRPIRVRFRWTPVNADLARWEQAFSTDGGQTWEVNWTMEHRRVQ